MKKRIIDYLIILVFVSLISIPLLNSNFNIYIDDGVQHIARLMGTSQSIAEGQIVPVIMSQFCNGFGYSWNIFYSPFTAYVPLIFSLFTASFELMLKLFMILITFLSGIAMYEFVYKVTKNRYAGLIASAIYLFAPYRLTDTYMRIAIAELASFVFLPIVFHGMYNIFNDEEKSIKKSLLLTLGASGLILSHNVIAMYTAIFCFIYLLINIKKLKDKQVLQMLGINIVLILLLTSFYTIPILEHKMATNYEVFQPRRMERTTELIRNKVDPLDLIYTKPNNFSFEISLVAILGIALTFFAFKKIEKEKRKMYWFSLASGIVCIILSLRFFPFEYMPSILKMIQFTFRLLEFSTFFFAFIAAINYATVIKNFNMKDVIVLSIVAYLLILPLNIVSYNKQWQESYLWPAVEVNENTGRVHAGCATFEYLPSKAFENMDYILNRSDSSCVLQGNATIKNEEKEGVRMSFEYENAEQNTIIELPYIYYLGYQVEITDENGNQSKVDTFESNNGFVSFELTDTQNGRVTVQYTGTTLMKISYIVSITTFIGIIIWLVVSKVRKRQ